jgi:hypothetical protein
MYACEMQICCCSSVKYYEGIKFTSTKFTILVRKTQ